MKIIAITHDPFHEYRTDTSGTLPAVISVEIRDDELVVGSGDVSGGYEMIAGGSELIQGLSNAAYLIDEEEKPEPLPPWKGNDYKTRRRR